MNFNRPAWFYPLVSEFPLHIILFFITYSIAITKKGGGKACSMRLLKPSWQFMLHLYVCFTCTHMQSVSTYILATRSRLYHSSQPIIIPSILCEWKWLKVKSLHGNDSEWGCALTAQMQTTFYCCYHSLSDHMQNKKYKTNKQASWVYVPTAITSSFRYPEWPMHLLPCDFYLTVLLYLDGACNSIMHLFTLLLDS